MGLLTKKDTKIFREFFKEMAYLRGISVKYQYPIWGDDESVSIHGEITPEYSRPIDMDIIFDENPRVDTLNKIGWISEYPDSKPVIAVLPFDAPSLATKCIISIPPFEEINSRARKFEVTSINTILEYPDSWTCTLAPIFDNDEPRTDYEDTNYNYTESDDQPDEDTPNNYEFLNVEDDF